MLNSVFRALDALLFFIMDRGEEGEVVKLHCHNPFLIFFSAPRDTVLTEGQTNKRACDIWVKCFLHFGIVRSRLSFESRL